jgi:hypothetical protein
MSIVSDVVAEVRSLLAARSGVADGVAPPLVFAALNATAGPAPAAIGGMTTALAITAWRLAGKRPLRFAVSGLAGTAVATALVLRSGRAETYFLPGILSGAATTIVALGSIAARRPVAALASWITRSWPLDWYWHPKIRPAYTQATWMWAAFFGTRTILQWGLYTRGRTETLATVRVVGGWPALLALLVATYVLGRRKLVRLAGPSVEEFRRGLAPPWSGQLKGF